MDTSTLIGTVDKAGRRKVQRRMYTLEDKQRVVAEANARGASVAQVARRHGINANLVFNWRRQDQQGVLEFGEWNQVFPNAACVVTLVDRLVHRSEILNIAGPSYRLKEAQERAARRKPQRSQKKQKQ